MGFSNPQWKTRHRYIPYLQPCGGLHIGFGLGLHICPCLANKNTFFTAYGIDRSRRSTHKFCCVLPLIFFGPLHSLRILTEFLFVFYEPLPIGVFSLFATCLGSCSIHFSSVLSTFSWRISFISCCWECCTNCNSLIKKLVFSVGILCCCCGPAPTPLAPFDWLGQCGMASLDFACNGMVLMFRVVFDFRGIICEGSICFPFLFPNSLVKSPI